MRRWYTRKTEWKLAGGYERRDGFRQKGGWRGASCHPSRSRPGRGGWDERRGRLPRSWPVFFPFRFEEPRIHIDEEYLATPKVLERHGKRESRLFWYQAAKRKLRESGDSRRVPGGWTVGRKYPDCIRAGRECLPFAQSCRAAIRKECRG